MSWIYNGVV